MTEPREYVDYMKDLATLNDELVLGMEDTTDPFEEQHLLAAISAIGTAVASLNLASLHKARALGDMRLNR